MTGPEVMLLPCCCEALKAALIQAVLKGTEESVLVPLGSSVTVAVREMSPPAGAAPQTWSGTSVDGAG